MADRPAELNRVMRGLFTLGTNGAMTDGQLLDRFLYRRDDGAEAAFEELLSRHGPMVFRVCRDVLHDLHDAEDAFQATFLVLAHQARSIRQKGSVASWLFGVAQRVASRAKLRVARQRVGDRIMAERTAEAYEQAAGEGELEMIHEAIARLPDHLRSPIVLCYLEGLSYEEAALRLGVSEATLRGRLARGRESSAS